MQKTLSINQSYLLTTIQLTLRFALSQMRFSGHLAVHLHICQQLNQMITSNTDIQGLKKTKLENESFYHEVLCNSLFFMPLWPTPKLRHCIPSGDMDTSNQQWHLLNILQIVHCFSINISFEKQMTNPLRKLNI